MKIGVGSIFALIIFALPSCSKDDTLNMGSASEPDIDVILVGEDLEGVYQYEYNSFNDTAIQSDLTQELGLGTAYLTLRQDGNLLSFYTYASGNFSLIQKNVVTGDSSLEANFYVENDERSILWGTNNGKNNYLGILSHLELQILGYLRLIWIRARCLN